MTYEQMLQQRLRALLETIDPGSPVTCSSLNTSAFMRRHTASGAHCGGEAMEVGLFDFGTIMPIPS